MECDSQGIVFNGSYLGYLEVAQAEYFRNLGIGPYKLARQGFFDAAMIKTVVEFKAPARVDNMLDLYLRIGQFGNTSFHINMEIYRDASDQLLTVAHAVNVGYDAGKGTSRRVPDEIRELVSQFESTGDVPPLERFPKLAETIQLENTS